MIVLAYLLLHSCMLRIQAPCGSTIEFVDVVVVSIIGTLFVSLCMFVFCIAWWFVPVAYFVSVEFVFLRGSALRVHPAVTRLTVYTVYRRL